MVKILPIIVTSIILFVAWEGVGFFWNETNPTTQIPTIISAIQREPNIQIENVFLLDNQTNRILDEIPRGGTIDWGTTVIIRIDVGVILPLTLSQFEITPKYEASSIFGEFSGISEPIEIGISNIFVKEKVSFLVLTLSEKTTYSIFLSISLRAPDGVLAKERLFEFAVVG